MRYSSVMVSSKKVISKSRVMVLWKCNCFGAVGVNQGQILKKKLKNSKCGNSLCRCFDTFDILGQDVNGVADYFQTKTSCDPRLALGQKVHSINNLR